MDTSSIDLAGSRIHSVTLEGDRVRVRFEPAYIIHSMTGSVERTRWWQNGELVFEDAEMEEEPPELPAVCAGGDVGENIYTYRDMIPVPLDSRGRAHCDLAVEGRPDRIRIRGAAVRLVMEDVPKYIEHIRPQED